LYGTEPEDESTVSSQNIILGIMQCPNE